MVARATLCSTRQFIEWVARHSQPAGLVYGVQPVKYLWLMPLVAGLTGLTEACDLSEKSAQDRPLTLEYVTQTILKPSCGTAECHSAFKAEKNDIFDSVAGAKETFEHAHQDLVLPCAIVAPQMHEDIATCEQNNDDLSNSYLIRVITIGDYEGNLMPLDQPMSNQNVLLLSRWIREGAEGLELGQ